MSGPLQSPYVHPWLRHQVPFPVEPDVHHGKRAGHDLAPDGPNGDATCLGSPRSWAKGGGTTVAFAALGPLVISSLKGHPGFVLIA
jgi:hypothetical protein